MRKYQHHLKGKSFKIWMVHSMPLEYVSGQSYSVKIRTFGSSLTLTYPILTHVKDRNWTLMDKWRHCHIKIASSCYIVSQRIQELLRALLKHNNTLLNGEQANWYIISARWDRKSVSHDHHLLSLWKPWAHTNTHARCNIMSMCEIEKHAWMPVYKKTKKS